MLLLVGGPSGVGKTTLLNNCAEMFGISTFLCTTTRPRRTNEVDEVDYRFVTREEFKTQFRKRAFPIWEYLMGNYYGFTNDLEDAFDRGEDCMLIVTGRLCFQIKDRWPSALSLFLDLPDATLSARVSSRHMTDEQAKRRQDYNEDQRELGSLFDEQSGALLALAPKVAAEKIAEIYFPSRVRLPVR